MDIKELKSYLKSLPNILDDQGDFRHERAKTIFIILRRSISRTSLA